MTCDDFRTAYLSGTEGEPELQHLAGCRSCREDRAALDGARRLLADDSLWEHPDSRLEDHVVGLISGAAPPPREAGRLRPWRKPLVAALAAAAVVTLVLAAGSLLRSPTPDWRVPLPGTAEAPEASGVVEGWNEPSGTRVVLTVDRLAPAPEGSVYEFWFSREKIHVSAGTFTGPGEVEMWVGVSRGAFPRLWVTLEPLDEDETPSGRTVLDTAPSG
jgi:hypothetical protein